MTLGEQEDEAMLVRKMRFTNSLVMAKTTSVERIRFDSESSNDSGFEGLEHLEPLDIDELQPYAQLDNTLDRDGSGDDLMPKVTLFSVAMALRRKKYGKPPPLTLRPQSRARYNWTRAISLISAPRKDPWEKFDLETIPTEKATRHRYNAVTKTWSLDEVVVKLDQTPFDRGAMRECYRMKKLSNFSHSQDWRKDSNNYVAKRYVSSVDRMTYFEDVKLQMDAKLWGEEFNRHNPPKKVDIFMMTVYEFYERHGCPLFHVEHFIDGHYIKYNSNSGFVDSKVCRQTPQSFSHFTFERSGHELIVVDVQGVGDLYTDPQIHTAEGKEYGEGNLGPKGMALFFHSHLCNRICKSLGLMPFDLSSAERADLAQSASSSRSESMTVLRGDELLCSMASDLDRADKFQDFFRQRSLSIESGVARSPCVRRASESSDLSSPPANIRSTPRERLVSESSEGRNGQHHHGFRRRQRFSTENSDGGQQEKDHMTFQEAIRGKARPSNLLSEVAREIDEDESILGQVHLQLAKYHEACRFTEDGQYDRDSALFHLRAAAECQIVPAILALGQIHCGLPHDILSDVSAPEFNSREENIRIGLSYLEKAGLYGDRNAMVYLARAYDTGLNLDDPMKRSVSKALYWYENISFLDEEEGDRGRLDWGMDDPPYVLLARQAEIWLNGEVDRQDPNKAGELYSKAAESATACMKGKLATNYYMLAEEAWAQCVEEEEEGGGSHD